MFNSKYKKEAIEDLKRANRLYEQTYNDAMKSVVSLHDERLASVELLQRIEDYINSIANRPKEFDKIIGEVTITRKRFQTELKELEIESKKSAQISGGVAGAGVAAGAGIAAFGPTAAMAIATTFGTASTGTAIASLSGAAATNAALAWLGGGTLALGGGGMAAGNAFLAMAGPVGWAIGGAALIGGGLLANSKNKKIAEEAEEATYQINKEKNTVKKTKTTVDAIKKLTEDHKKKLKENLYEYEWTYSRDYLSLSQEQKMNLGTFVNNTHSLSKLIAKRVG